MIRYKFESNSQRDGHGHARQVNVYAMIRYKFESNSQHAPEEELTDEECVCYA